MLVKKLGLSMILFGLVMLTGCAAALIKGGPPAGPIVVVDPDPGDPGAPINPRGKDQTVQCDSPDLPCWYLGSFDSDHAENLPDHIPYDRGTNEDPPKLPHYLHRNAGVAYMTVSLESKPEVEIDISKIELELESKNWLVIELKNRRDVPVWSFNNVEMKDKRRSRTKLPKLVLTKITSVKVTERPNQPTHDRVTLDNLNQFRMYYMQ